MVRYDADVVVQVDEKLTEEQIHEIEEKLFSVKGVVSDCFHLRHPLHLFVIDYDSSSTHTGQLLQEVKILTLEKTAHRRLFQTSLRSRETFRDLPVTKMDSILENLLLPWPSSVHVVPSLPHSEATTQHSLK